MTFISPDQGDHAILTTESGKTIAVRLHNGVGLLWYLDTWGAGIELAVYDEHGSTIRTESAC